jgi:GDP-L-fucose synthase
VWGRGRPVREWLYVDDACEAMIRSMDIAPYDDIINVGVAEGYSIKETAEVIADIVGYTGKIVYDTSKLDGAACKRVDGSLCRKLLGWSPQKTFKTGLRDTIDWYIEQEDIKNGIH